MIGVFAYVAVVAEFCTLPAVEIVGSCVSADRVKLVTGVVELTTKGADPVERVEVIWPEEFRVVNAPVPAVVAPIDVKFPVEGVVVPIGVLLIDPVVIDAPEIVPPVIASPLAVPPVRAIAFEF